MRAFGIGNQCPASHQYSGHGDRIEISRKICRILNINTSTHIAWSYCENWIWYEAPFPHRRVRFCVGYFRIPDWIRFDSLPFWINNSIRLLIDAKVNVKTENFVSYLWGSHFVIVALNLSMLHEVFICSDTVYVIIK